MLDEDGALIDASAAGGTCPESHVADDAADHLRAGGDVAVAVPAVEAANLGVGHPTLSEHLVTKVYDDMLGVERHPGVPGGAGDLASPTLGTGVKVEELLPGEVA
jgi:hypothetical protein